MGICLSPTLNSFWRRCRRLWPTCEICRAEQRLGTLLNSPSLIHRRCIANDTCRSPHVDRASSNFNTLGRSLVSPKLVFGHVVAPKLKATGSPTCLKSFLPLAKHDIFLFGLHVLVEAPKLESFLILSLAVEDAIRRKSVTER